MEIINSTRIHNLLSGDVWASQLSNAVPELSHCSVVLRTPKQTHVSVGQVLWYWQGFAVRPNKGTYTYSSHMSPERSTDLTLCSLFIDVYGSSGRTDKSCQPTKIEQARNAAHICAIDCGLVVRHTVAISTATMM